MIGYAVTRQWTHVPKGAGRHRIMYNVLLLSLMPESICPGGTEMSATQYHRRNQFH